MAYKSKKSGKRNARSGGHKHFNAYGVKKPAAVKAEKK
jgi:hypothetical protein